MLGPLHCLSVAAFIFPNAAMLSFLSSQSIFLELFVADDFGVLKSRVSSRQPRSFSFGKRIQNHWRPVRPQRMGRTQDTEDGPTRCAHTRPAGSLERPPGGPAAGTGRGGKEVLRAPRRISACAGVLRAFIG